MWSVTDRRFRIPFRAAARIIGSRVLGVSSGRPDLARVFRSALLIGALSPSALVYSTAGRAAEFAQSTYLLGIGSSLAGFTPPPGIYFQTDNYFYSGQIGGGRQLSFGPAVGVNVRQDTWLTLPTTLLVMPAEIFGGSLGFAVTAPFFGIPSVNPTIQVDFPRLNRARRNKHHGGPVQCRRHLRNLLPRMAERRLPLAARRDGSGALRHL